MWQWIDNLGMKAERGLKVLKAFGSRGRKAREKLFLESEEENAYVLWKQFKDTVH